MTDLTATVSQNGVEIGEDGTLTSDDPISVEVSFGVPVEGDDPAPDNPVQKGDTATFELSSAFKIISSNSIALKMGSITVGHVSFSTNPGTNMVSANVVFDGDEGVFDGTYNTVACKFSANFEYDASGDAGSTGDHLVTILEKSYTVVVPAPEIQYEVTKSGTPDLATKSIEWTVGVSATQGGADIDLSGYQFSDDLSTVGTYLADSFAVGGASATPTVDGSKLCYTFPSGSASPQTITFKTTIPDEMYYGAGEQGISNEAQLLDDTNNIMDEGSTEVTFTPEWIEKTGESSDAGSTGTYNPTGRTITWTITANQMGTALNNVVITDLLPERLTLESAGWQAWDGTAWGAATPISPNGSGEYVIGNISSQILLTIVTNVPDDVYTTEGKTYANSASIKWDGLPGTGIGSGNVNVGVGYNAIAKSGVPDTENRSVHWTINVDTKGQSIPDPKVYDLLVYGSSSSGFSFPQASGFPSGMTPTDLTPRYDQKYIDGSFSGSGLSITVHPIVQGGEQVADLLEITGLSTAAPNTFTFDSLVVNPNVFAGNKTSQVWNTVSLFSANEKLNAASNKVNYPSNMLAKEMLKHEAISDPAAGVNNKTTDTGELRWTVDYNPYNLPQLGTKLEDTLPVGIDLRTDSNGTLLLSDGNITAHEMTLNADGSCTVGDEVTLTIGENLFYDHTTRVLTFLIPDSAKAYRFSYLTDVTGDPGTISNKVSLYGDSATQEETAQPYMITSADGEATLQRNGWIIITKVDGAGSSLAGAEFSIFASDGQTVIRRGVTGSDGTVKLRAIPDGEYILRETAAPAGYTPDGRTHSLTVTTTGSTVVASIDDKTGTDANAITIQNYLDGTVGNLTISKTVAGNVADNTKPFDFTITFVGANGTYHYIGNGVPDGTIKSGDTISLAHGQSITIAGLPKDTDYTVSEADYSGSGYSKSSTGETGTIVADATQAVSFTNTRNVSHPDPDDRTGTLTISKTVVGTGADTSKEFAFTVTFTGASGSYRYTGNSVPDGTIKSGDTISLSNGQSITITGLPAGAGYQVDEDRTVAQGYSVESTGSSGTISSSRDRTAAFTNTKLPGTTGSLTISKTVTGEGADLNKKFDFTVTLTDAPGTYPYTGTYSGPFRSGDTISLANGESITITGLPEGTKYTVAEADYTADGYTASSTGDVGVISAATSQTASFTNSWSNAPSEPGKPENPSDNIGDGDIPQGSMDGGESGMPKTGDSQAGSLAKLGLLFFSAALAALSTADFVLRRKYSGKRSSK